MARTRHELVEAEGLGHVVVGPHRKPTYFVVSCIAGGEEQQGRT